MREIAVDLCLSYIVILYRRQFHVDAFQSTTTKLSSEVDQGGFLALDF